MADKKPPEFSPEFIESLREIKTRAAQRFPRQRLEARIRDKGYSVSKDGFVVEWGETGRGFKVGHFKDDGRQACSIQESSAAEQEMIWLGVAGNERMHLTREMATVLGEILTRFGREGEL